MPTKLGQNFLKDKNIVKKIIDSANLQPDDFVVEIGPGEGILTEELAKYAKKVLAIEIDPGLAEKLQKKLKNHKNVEIIKADILKINLPELVKKQKIKNNSYKVIANLPYYITSPIIRLFLETGFPPKEMTLMVQKEVAERICRSAGKMSILAVSVQYYARPKLLFEVHKKAFSPVPRVDSAVIKIADISQNISLLTENKQFFRLIKAGFCAKRKTLINNLSSSLHLDKKIIEEKLKKIDLKPTVRAQELSLKKWKELSKIM